MPQLNPRTHSTNPLIDMETIVAIPRYSCGYEGCGAQFAQLAQLQVHISNNHKSTEFPCPECGKVFSRSYTRDAHLQTHDLNRIAHDCPHEGCNKSYMSEKSLKMHIRAIHEQVKPFKCTESGCGSRFSYKCILLRHQKLHDPQERKRQTQLKTERQEAKEQARRNRAEMITDIDMLTGRDYADPELSGRPIACIVEACPFRFKRFYDRNRHMLSAHVDYRVPSNRPVNCQDI